MIVQISAEAEFDLEGIGDYIAQDNPSRAVSFVQELRAQCLDLAHMPIAFPLVPRYEQHGIRRRIHGNYLIFYRIDHEQIIVTHVLHGAVNYASILFSDERRLPFDVKVPTATTRKAIAELEAGNAKRFDDIDDLMADLHADD